MREKISLLVASLIFVLCFVSSALASTPIPSEEKKQTIAGKYTTAEQAYAMWKANPDKVKILDCRTPEEYVYVGHPEMAHNVPSSVWTGKWNEDKKSFDLQENPDFEATVRKMFQAEDTILVMCRSGQRSATAVNRLTKAGFTNVYNITDGFEGDMVKDAESSFNGKRMRNGWKNSGAPWTYNLEPTLADISQAQ